MCLFDLKTGRQKDAGRAVANRANINGSPQRMSAGNPNRTALLVTAVSGWSTLGECVALSSSANLDDIWAAISPDSPHLMARVEDYGVLVTGEVWLTAFSTNDISCAVAEVRLLKELDQL